MRIPTWIRFDDGEAAAVLAAKAVVAHKFMSYRNIERIDHEKHGKAIVRAYEQQREAERRWLSAANAS